MAESFWYWLLMACLLWYTVITIYVSIRGAWDIKSMLARIKSLQDEPASDAESDAG